MDSYDIQAWIQAIVRWIHVFAGILWIGQTYLFNFFEKNLRKNENDDKIAGNLWMVHGGGFFFVEKQKFRQQMPAPLHWFKWEAAFTWISGFILLGLVYYMGGILVDPDMDFVLAVGVGLGALVLGWVVYDLLMRSPLRKHEVFFSLFALVLIMAIHYGLSKALSTRAAFFHIGALMGTIMTTNVWNRILPAQRKILNLMKEGKEPDSGLLAIGPQRSKHNSFMVIPLLFIMISSHYPTISYGHEYSSFILGVIILIGWGGAWVFRK